MFWGKGASGHETQWSVIIFPSRIQDNSFISSFILLELISALILCPVYSFFQAVIEHLLPMKCQVPWGVCEERGLGGKSAIVWSSLHL